MIGFSKSHVRRRIGVLATIAAGCSVAALAAAPVHAATPTISDAEQQEVTLVNGFRASNGLKPLTIDATLTTDAAWMSQDMATNSYFAHTDSLGRDPFARQAAFGYPTNTWRGENLAAGNEDTEATLEQWENSPEHRANMLNANYTVIGIGYVSSPGSQYGSYWTTEFGSQLTKGVGADTSGSSSGATVTSPAATPAATPAAPAPTTTAPKTPAKPAGTTATGSFSNVGAGGAGSGTGVNTGLLRAVYECHHYKRGSVAFRKLGCTQVLSSLSKLRKSEARARAQAESIHR